jgi:hypothetical protein
MTSGSLTWGVELDRGPNKSDTIPFPEENAIMMVYEGRPLLGRRCESSLSPRAPTCYGWGHRGLRGVTAQVFHHPNKIPMYIYINSYSIAVLRGKLKRERRKRKNDRADNPKSRA